MLIIWKQRLYLVLDMFLAVTGDQLSGKSQYNVVKTMIPGPGQKRLDLTLTSTSGGGEKEHVSMVPGKSTMRPS